jgi:hypothetical protein
MDVFERKRGDPNPKVVDLNRLKSDKFNAAKEYVRGNVDLPEDQDFDDAFEAASGFVTVHYRPDGHIGRVELGKRGGARRKRKTRRSKGRRKTTSRRR